MATLKCRFSCWRLCRSASPTRRSGVIGGGLLPSVTGGARNRRRNIKSGTTLVLSTTVTPMCATSFLRGNVEISFHPSVVAELLFHEDGAFACYLFSGVGSGARLIHAMDPHCKSVVSSIWRLYSVGALLGSGAIKSYARVPTLPSSPCKVSSPCTTLEDGAWDPRRCFQRWFHHLQRAYRRILMSFGSAPLPVPLVPILLA